MWATLKPRNARQFYKMKLHQTHLHSTVSDLHSGMCSLLPPLRPFCPAVCGSFRQPGLLQFSKHFILSQGHNGTGTYLANTSYYIYVQFHFLFIHLQYLLHSGHGHAGSRSYLENAVHDTPRLGCQSISWHHAIAIWHSQCTKHVAWFVWCGHVENMQKCSKTVIC